MPPRPGRLASPESLWWTWLYFLSVSQSADASGADGLREGFGLTPALDLGGRLRLFAARVGDAQRDDGGGHEEDAGGQQRPLEARRERVGRGRVACQQVAGA